MPYWILNGYARTMFHLHQTRTFTENMVQLCQTVIEKNVYAVFSLVFTVFCYFLFTQFFQVHFASCDFCWNKNNLSKWKFKKKLKNLCCILILTWNQLYLYLKLKRDIQNTNKTVLTSMSFLQTLNKNDWPSTKNYYKKQMQNQINDKMTKKLTFVFTLKHVK